MKKVIFLFLIVLLFSCEKEPVYCWQCETVKGDEVISSITACSFTETEIREFEKGLEIQAEALAGIECNTTCKKK